MKTHLSLPSMLRIRNETPAVQAALLAAPLALAGAALLAGWWWRQQRGAPARGPSQDWLRRLVTNLEMDTSRHEVLAFIRDTLLGLRKPDVLKLLGEPSAAADGGVIVADPAPARQKLADHWYYRLDRLSAGQGDRGDSALVVEFDESDRAADAQFLVPARRR